MHYTLAATVEHAYTAHVARAVVNGPATVIAVKQVAGESLARRNHALFRICCSEQNCGDGLCRERHLETVNAVVARSGGSALRICIHHVFFQGVVCVRNERFALEVLQRECFYRSIGGEVREAEVHVLGVFFGAVHEDDRERIALVTDGTIGGHERVVAGGRLYTVRVAVAAEQVHRFVHAVAPCPRGKNLDAVILHGSEERSVGKCRDHGVGIVQVGFGDAERDAVILAEVLFEPVVDAHEDVGPVALLLVAPVALARSAAHTVAALVVVGGIEQNAMPVDAAFVVFFGGVPVDVEHVEKPHAARLFSFGDFLGEEFKPAVFLAVDLWPAFFVVGIDVAPLPFVGDYGAGKLDVAPGGAGLLGNVDVAFNEEISGDGQVQVVVGAAPDFYLVVHAPVFKTAHVVLEFVFPVRDDADRGIGGPFHVVKRGVARLDERLAVF